MYKATYIFQYLQYFSIYNPLVFKWFINGEFDRDLGNTNGGGVLDNISMNNCALVINHKLENTAFFFSIETLIIDIDNPKIDHLFRKPNGKQFQVGPT